MPHNRLNHIIGFIENKKNLYGITKIYPDVTAES
jgi:hypothetical protein